MFHLCDVIDTTTKSTINARQSPTGRLRAVESFGRLPTVSTVRQQDNQHDCAGFFVLSVNIIIDGGGQGRCDDYGSDPTSP